ncbi:hypothetical protein LWI29_030509 [Acer saccharum]|uniref:MULE transposase domain-containing protein n=1 Tax=Acer saccharum TaxID=4024 RepID=A0AA39SBN5_ACESA|nr:hypothetical protein LWI29_030509 [Acer saccharum]
MIYPLAFGFANYECTKSWTWFLKKLRKMIKNPDRVMLVSDRHNGIFNAMEAIFPNATHGVCAYHLAQNLKRFCKQRNDLIWLYYRATYAYRIEDFDRAMDGGGGVCTSCEGGRGVCMSSVSVWVGVISVWVGDAVVVSFWVGSAGASGVVLVWAGIAGAYSMWVRDTRGVSVSVGSAEAVLGSTEAV